MHSIRLIIFQLVFLLFAGCGNQSYKSERINSKITVDGHSEDWSGIPLNYIEDLEMVIGFVNDDSILYGMFRFSDHILARKIHMRGAILWIDPEKDEEKRFGIRYRRQFSGPPPERNNMRADRDPVEQRKVDLTGSFMVVQGDDKISSGLEFYPGIDAEAGTDQSLYVFEFTIPLNSDADGVLRELPAHKGTIGIGVEISAISEEERNELKQLMAERGGGGRSDGGKQGGRGMNGGGRSGGGRGGMQGMQEMPDLDSQELWFNLTLAK